MKSANATYSGYRKLAAVVGPLFTLQRDGTTFKHDVTLEYNDLTLDLTLMLCRRLSPGVVALCSHEAKAPA